MKFHHTYKAGHWGLGLGLESANNTKQIFVQLGRKVWVWRRK